MLWKRRQRQASRREPYWLDHWIKVTGDIEAARRAYNEYMRRYMRRYRRNRQARGPTRPKDRSVNVPGGVLLAA